MSARVLLEKEPTQGKTRELMIDCQTIKEICFFSYFNSDWFDLVGMGLQPFTISEPGTVQPHPLVGNFVHFWWSTYFEFLITLHRHDHLSISVICGFIIFCVGLEICTVKSGACYVCFKFLSCLQGSIVDTYKPSTQHACHIWIWNCLVKVNISWLWPKVSILFAPD